MKIWITGASGLAGRAVTKILSQHHDVFASGFSRTSEIVKSVDLISEEQVERVFLEEKPAAVIHLAAERKPDICENNHEQTLALNVESSKRLADLSRKNGVWLLYLSTDYVFDGTKPPYEVDAEPNPLNFYGTSKLKGEEVVLNEYPQSCVLRVPVLYGEVECLRESAVTSIANGLISTEPAPADHWATRFPTLVDDIGRAINLMLAKKPAGIFHYSAKEAMTKFEILQLMASELDLPADHISPAEGVPGGAPRPQNCQLSTRALEEIGCYAEPTSIKDVIGGILRKHI